MTNLTEPNFPEHDGPKCDQCGCPVVVGLFISRKYRKVCQACWALYHNERFDKTIYWDNQ